MPNNAYLRSRKREQDLVRDFRNRGWISARSAGSKSPVDVWCVNPLDGEVRLIQIKTKKGGRGLIKKLQWSKNQVEFWLYTYA
jgi:Holliday junction resolvase